ncbi:MAG: glycosyltransferase [Planctomycetia bacterium]|nr:glycosyltransferase [Planctomycetia bacterium]
MDVDVGFIYTHERNFMTPLVSSLAQSAHGVSMRMILVDNASDDGVDEWRHAVPGTIVVRNNRRLGYAANLNRILEASTARYALLMNTDMYFVPAEQCVAKMVRFMDAHPDCGVSGCRLYRPDGSFGFPARRFQTLKTIAARRLGMPRLYRDTVNSYLYRDKPHDSIFECDWLSGCFLMVRRQALAEVGRLDERFRKYFEDVDFCLRTALAGWRVMMNGQTWCYHLEQRASRKLFSKDALLHLHSYLRWLAKWGLHPERNIRRIPREEPARRAA